MVDEYSEEYWEEEYYDSLETSLGNSQSRHDEEIAEALLFASLIATTLVGGVGGEPATFSEVSSGFSKAMPLDLKYLNEGKNLLETTGQFGYHEGMLQGQLEVYQIEGAIPMEGAIAVEGVKGYILGIPWTTCEDNGNCSGASPVCDECQGLSGEVFEADGFEPYAHNWCRCNEPLADPVIMESW